MKRERMRQTLNHQPQQVSFVRYPSCRIPQDCQRLAVVKEQFVSADGTHRSHSAFASRMGVWCFFWAFSKLCENPAPSLTWIDNRDKNGAAASFCRFSMWQGKSGPARARVKHCRWIWWSLKDALRRTGSWTLELLSCSCYISLCFLISLPYCLTSIWWDH